MKNSVLISIPRIFSRLAVAGLVACAAIMPSTAEAAGIALQSSVLAEQRVKAADGAEQVEWVPAETVVPGDSLTFVLKYRNDNADKATNFVITNPLPDGILVATVEPGQVASVDGGKTFDRVEALSVPAADGTRVPAGPSDLTHLRWTIAEIPAAGAGEIRFLARVR